MTDHELKKFLYQQELLGIIRGVPSDKTMWLGEDALRLSAARIKARSGTLPNPYLITVNGKEWKPNGMGPRGFLARFVPDSFWGLLPKHCLEAIADVHDMGWLLAEDNLEMIDANDLFHDMFKAAGRDLPWFQRAALGFIHRIYCAGVRGLGRFFFKRGKCK